MDSTAKEFKQITVNLLPQEIILQKSYSAKLIILRKISLTTLFLMVALTALTLVLRLDQNLHLKKSSDNLAYAQDQVSALQEKERNALLLKQRISAIANLLNLDNQRKELFNMVTEFAPPEIVLGKVSIDKNNNLAMEISSSSLLGVEKLFNNLSDPNKTNNLFKKVDLDGLSLDKDGMYHFSLNITVNK